MRLLDRAARRFINCAIQNIRAFVSIPLVLDQSNVTPVPAALLLIVNDNEFG